MTLPGIIGKWIGLRQNKTIETAETTGWRQGRRWRLWQVEASLRCNLECVMCPWKGIRGKITQGGDLSPDIWNSLVPYLQEVQAIDFTGGGEPLLNQHLLSWIRQAKTAGCEAGFLTNGLLLQDELITKLIATKVDWIGISLDGADRETYEKIRQGADFDAVCDRIRSLTGKRRDGLPRVMINVVMMTLNRHQLEEMVRLADRLNVDQINLKQCDVVRDSYGKGFGLFAANETGQISQLRKSLRHISRLAEKLGIKLTAFSFVPEELPICTQDPRHSLFIGYNGNVSPCINLALGGTSVFLDNDITFPTLIYGTLPQDNLMDLWRSEQCKSLRNRFECRLGSHDRVLASYEYGNSIIKLKAAFQAAVKAMPAAPSGCRHCHYLYDI